MRGDTWTTLRELSVKDTWVGPCVLHWDPKMNLNQENVLEMQERAAEGGVQERGNGVNLKDVPKSPCTKAKNRVRSYHRFKSAQQLRKACHVPGPRLGSAGDTERTQPEHSRGSML